jgi:hypothetical protein
MVECMVFGKRAKNSRCIHALHVNKTFNTYRARLQKLANKVFFHSLQLRKITELQNIQPKSNRNRALHQNLIRNSLRNGVKVKLRWYCTVQSRIAKTCK